MRAVTRVSACLFALMILLFLGHKAFDSFKTRSQTSSLGAPANVTATDNAYATKVAVQWDAVRGATLYRIFRNTTNNFATAAVIGTTPQAIFFDNTSAPNQAFFYWVRAENSSIVSGLSQPDQGSRTGGAIVGPLAPLEPPAAPLGNQVTAAKAYLGKALFWDEQLSSTRTVACGTCHFAANGGSDVRAIVNSTRARNAGADGVFNTADDVFASPGVISNNSDGTYNWSPTYGFHEQVTGRKSRSYIDAGYSNSLFWDGRATATFTDPIGGGVVLQNGAALESQVLGPPVSSAEMAHVNRTWNDVAVRVAQAKPLALSPSLPAALSNWIAGRTYSELFEEAFGTPEITPARIALAIASFERTVYSDRTRFDQAVAQIAPLSAAETRGQGVFNASRCNVCHAGNLFSDNAFHNIGVRPQFEDTGRFQVTANANNIGEFRTPSLRNVSLRAPYFHNGRMATLEDVVEFYNRGGDFDAPNINHNLIRPLNLSVQQKADLVAFLRALTDSRVATGAAPFDRPMLYTESSRIPQIIGGGSAGSGGNIPQVTAIEPPIVGNPTFTVGISNALGGAEAVLAIDSHDPGAVPPASAALHRSQIHLSGSGAGQGFASVPVAIPDSSAVVGVTFFGRWYVTDPNAAGGAAVSPLFKFTVFNASTAATAAIDDPSFFVHQQYLDFLAREPEPGADGVYGTADDAMNFYLNILNGCQPGDVECSKYTRGALSANFFRSPEFQAKGSYVMYLYMVTLGQRAVTAAQLQDPSKIERPHYAEFASDMSAISSADDRNGPDPGKKAALTQDFVQRPEVVAKYPTSTYPTLVSFANALAATAGLSLSSSTQNAIAAAATRAQVLQIVAESAEVNAKFYKPAFVTMEYFGYLRRDPEDCHDSANWWGTGDPNACGYIYHNNRFNDLALDPDLVQNFIVRGFIESPEYRKRF
jgi:cytochrome c peroxidase